ncbi:MAG: transporter substrate-binding domain-containing protein [Atopobiaceae bacterium]|nr:transporter substrate-binding domain-containing protein [Atopobiaceae bacterium]
MKLRKGFSRIFMVAFAAVLAVTLGACEQIEPLVEQYIDPLIAKIMPTTIEEARAGRDAQMIPVVSSPTIMEDGVLTVGLDTTSTAPLYFTNSQGDSVGIDVDLAYALAAQMGLKVRFVPVAGVAGMMNTPCDILMSAQEGASPDVVVVGGYAEHAIAFFYRGGETVLTSGELTGHSCGVQGGSASERALNISGISMPTVQFSNLNEAFDALARGEVEFVLCDAYSGAYLAATHEGISCAGSIDVPVSVGVGVSAANPDLQVAVQGALDTLSNNGVGSLARSRWVGSFSRLSSSSQVPGVANPAPEAPAEEPPAEG